MKREPKQHARRNFSYKKWKLKKLRDRMLNERQLSEPMKRLGKDKPKRELVMMSLPIQSGGEKRTRRFYLTA
jgi:hypothetical protein